jgi:UDP:flavonoid glycosyltransferase YjiC (YdhE family)
MHFLLVSMGTYGDVLPFVGLGAELKRRGRRVTFVANEEYATWAERYGFEFTSLLSNADTLALLGHPDIWHPVKSALLGARWMKSRLAAQYETLKPLIEPDTVIVSYPPIFGARMLHELVGVPLVSIVPMPWVIPSGHNPPDLMAAFNMPAWAPRILKRAHWRTLEAASDFIIGRHINRVRSSLGLKKQRQVARWAFSPQMTIGLFPDWYAAPQLDWPANFKTAGFSDFDGGDDAELPAELMSFINAGEPPVAFTFGTGMRHGERMFRMAVDVCEQLKVRGILLSRFEGQVPASLPSGVIRCEYAPFRKLFPKCAAAVHHGGLGTTAQALAAGTPQLILPFAWDQRDNGLRVKRLGAGDWLPSRSSAEKVARALKPLLTPAARARCEEWSRRCREASANVQAVDWIEEFALDAVVIR